MGAKAAELRGKNTLPLFLKLAIGTFCFVFLSFFKSKISDLTENVQRYVNEVKRIEELLALRDKERSELLEQYRHLTIEADSAETYGRKMEGQVR